MIKNLVWFGGRAEGADLSPLPLHVEMAGKNHMKVEITRSSQLG